MARRTHRRYYSGIKYLLRDEFTTALAAGSVNGTLANPGPGGTRTVVDLAGDKLSTIGGRLEIADGSGGWGDPGLWYANLPLVRTPGRILSFVAVPSGITGGEDWWVGFDTNAAGTIGDLAYLQHGTGIYMYNGTTGDTLGPIFTPIAGIPYQFWIALRTNGGFMWHKAPSDSVPTLDGLDDSLNSSPLYVGLTVKGLPLTIDDFIIRNSLWLPAPLASDGFSAWGTTDGKGHAEGVAGGIGSGGSGLAWTAVQGTWGAAGGIASCSALDGGTSLGLAIVPTSSADGIHIVYLTRTAGAGGLVLRYVDVDNYLYAYHDGTNVALIKRMAGVESNVIAPAAVAYAAGAPLMVILDGTSAYLWYNRAQVGATGAVAASVATAHGLYVNNVAPTFDNFQVWARR